MTIRTVLKSSAAVLCASVCLAGGWASAAEAAQNALSARDRAVVAVAAQTAPRR